MGGSVPNDRGRPDRRSTCTGRSGPAPEHRHRAGPQWSGAGGRVGGGSEAGRPHPPGPRPRFRPRFRFRYRRSPARATAGPAWGHGHVTHAPSRAPRRQPISARAGRGPDVAAGRDRTGPAGTPGSAPASGRGPALPRPSAASSGVRLRAGPQPLFGSGFPEPDISVLVRGIPYGIWASRCGAGRIGAGNLVPVHPVAVPGIPIRDILFCCRVYRSRASRTGVGPSAPEHPLVLLVIPVLGILLPQWDIPYQRWVYRGRASRCRTSRTGASHPKQLPRPRRLPAVPAGGAP